MKEGGTTYAEARVFKTMQRMKEPLTRAPYARLERVGKQGFQLARPIGPPAHSALSRSNGDRHQAGDTSRIAGIEQAADQVRDQDLVSARRGQSRRRANASASQVSTWPLAHPRSSRRGMASSRL
jgi:hypothetical protein